MRFIYGASICGRVSSAIALTNPVFGGGFHAVHQLRGDKASKKRPALFGFMESAAQRSRQRLLIASILRFWEIWDLLVLAIFLTILV